jgi:hypothetical protein
MQTHQSQLFQGWQVLQVRAAAIHMFQQQVLQHKASQVLAKPQNRLAVAPCRMPHCEKIRAMEVEAVGPIRRVCTCLHSQFPEWGQVCSGKKFGYMHGRACHTEV